MVTSTLSRATHLVPGYVELRNRFLAELDTRLVTVESTQKWLASDVGDVVCFVDGGTTVAAAIVRDTGEVSVFSSLCGMGEQLLAEAENLARTRGLRRVWARVLPSNEKSVSLFERYGYVFGDGHYSKDLYSIAALTSPFPKMIVLSVTYVCNATCPVCPYNNADIRRTYHDAPWLPKETLQRIADEAGPHGTVLRFTGGGEPMLHPDIVEMTAYSKAAGCKVSIITNGSRSVEPVLEIADMVEFSVDAGSAEEYAKVRPGLDWNRLVWNVARARIGRKTTHLICSIVNQNGVDVERAKMVWGILDAVQVRKYLTWGYNRDMSADATPYLDPQKQVPCPWIFERLNIDTRGDVTFCGEDIAFAHRFGNIREKTIAEMWNGPEFTALRTAHLERTGYPKMCTDCPDWKYRTWDYNYWRLRKNAGGNTSA